MKMLIASDLHGSLESLRFLISKAKEIKPDLVVLLGDLVYHGPRNPLPSAYDTISVLDTMPELRDLPYPVTAVKGNCDGEVDMGLLPFPLVENEWINTDGLQIFASHGHKLPAQAPAPGLPKGAVVLHGHTHIPRGETINGMHFWNPGSLSLPKGGFPRSYGLFEDGVFRVLDMNDREILRHEPLAA